MNRPVCEGTVLGGASLPRYLVFKLPRRPSLYPRKSWCASMSGRGASFPASAAVLRALAELPCFKPAAASHMRIVGPQGALWYQWMRIAESALSRTHCVRQTAEKAVTKVSVELSAFSLFHCFVLCRRSVYRVLIAAHPQISFSWFRGPRKSLKECSSANRESQLASKR